MAVTKIHPIKSTLKKALDYIENPDKTYDKMLVSSFACSYETADIEFEMLLAQAYQKGNNLAHHLIQSFAPGEATPEQAHEIGRQLADEVLQGKYPYVLTTHIDKGLVHNHIIFCAVDMVNQRKYISNKQSYVYIRRTSDRLCKENGLSVVKPGQSKGKSGPSLTGNADTPPKAAEPSPAGPDCSEPAAAKAPPAAGPPRNAPPSGCRPGRRPRSGISVERSRSAYSPRPARCRHRCGPRARPARPPPPGSAPAASGPPAAGFQWSSYQITASFFHSYIIYRNFTSYIP